MKYVADPVEFTGYEAMALRISLPGVDCLVNAQGSLEKLPRFGMAAPFRQHGSHVIQSRPERGWPLPQISCEICIARLKHLDTLSVLPCRLRRLPG